MVVNGEVLVQFRDQFPGKVHDDASTLATGRMDRDFNGLQARSSRLGMKTGRVQRL